MKLYESEEELARRYANAKRYFHRVILSAFLLGFTFGAFCMLMVKL